MWKVYSWGYNDYCELGNRSTNEGLTPTLISSALNDEFVVDIACGGHHSLALTNKGEVKWKYLIRANQMQNWYIYFRYMHGVTMYLDK